MERQGKLIMLIGVIVVVVGLIVWLAGDKLKFLGRLPGDIRYESEHVRIYVPITTMLLISLFLSGVIWLVQRFR